MVEHLPTSSKDHTTFSDSLYSPSARVAFRDRLGKDPKNL